MAEVQDIPQVAPPEEGQTGGDQQPPDKVSQYYDYLKKAGADVAPSLDSFKKTLSNDSTARQYYGYLKDHKFDAPPDYGSFSRTLGIQTAPAEPEHTISHTPVQDIRHLNDLANQPIGKTSITGSSTGAGAIELDRPEDVARNKAYQDRYDKAVTDLAGTWGTDTKLTKQAIQDFPGEPDENKLKGFAGLAKDNPVYYGRLKSANDIRTAIAQSGSDGVNDANVFNHLQTADDYDQLQHNIATQQEIMRKHGLGQAYFEKQKESQAPLINTLEPGLLVQYWNSDDTKLGLSDFQYAGLETEKMFNPGKYQQDMKIIRQNRGLDDPSQGGQVPQGKEGYAYDRGVENVLYALENQGRQNTGKFIDQRSAELGPSINQLKDKYQQWINSTTDPMLQKHFQEEFQNDPMLQEAGKLDEGQQSIDYARTEDQRRFPLNYGDQASRLVKDAMSTTNGWAGVAGKQVLLGAGESADNTARFVKNTFINLLGSEQLKAENAASNIGHQALTELGGYEGSAFSQQQSPLLVGAGLIKSIQDTFNDPSLSVEQKNQKATDLVLNHEGEIKINPKAGQQNLSGKAVIYSAANTIGQILGIADQSLLMGGLLGDAAKAQQMANAVVPMYASTQNQLYEQALARGDEKPLLSSHLDAAIISLASLINPDIKVVKGMVGAETGIGKLIAGVDESTWNKVLSSNRPMVDRMIAGTKATARQLGLANLQYGLIVPTAQYVVHKNVLNEDPNLGDAIKDGLLQTSISMALPALLHGVWGGVNATKVNPSQKYAIVEAGLHPKENIELIDQLVEKGQITPDRADQIKEIIKQTGHILEHTDGIKSDGTPMTEQDVSNVTYQMLRKKILEGKLKNAPDPQKPAIEAKLHEINQDIADMHTSEADKHKSALNQLLTDNLGRIRDKIEPMESQVREAIKRNEPEGVFKEIYDQATQTTKLEGKEVSTRPATEEIFGKALVEKAFELHNQKTETNGKTQNADNAQTGNEGQVTSRNPTEDSSGSSLETSNPDTDAYNWTQQAGRTKEINGEDWALSTKKYSEGPLVKIKKKILELTGKNYDSRSRSNWASAVEENPNEAFSQSAWGHEGIITVFKNGNTKVEINGQVHYFDKDGNYIQKNENGKPQEGAAPETAGPVEPAASSFLQSRHADTIHDEQGIVSGPNNKELSPKGKRDANDLAKDVEGKGVTKIITSGLERSKETGAKVADKIGAAVESRPGLDTWNIKDFDGLKDDEFKAVQQWFVENPDQKVYNGPEEKYKGKEVAESINEYAKRIIPEMESIEKQAGPETLVINHSNNMMLWDAYLKNGREWNDQARQDYLNAEKPEPATLANQTKNDAIPERSTTGEVPHPGATGENIPAGGEGVGPGQQGQAPAGEAGGPQEGKEPPGGAGGKTITAGEEDPNTVGPSHDALTALALRLGLKEPERGVVLTPAEYAARGRIMIIGGADPEKVARTFKRTGNISPDVVSVARAHLEDLVRAADKAGDDFGEDSEQYKSAIESLQKWQDDVMKPMGTRAGETFTSLQGERDIDTGSFTSIKRAFQEQSGKPLTEKQSETAKELHTRIKEQETTISDLQKKLDEAHNSDQSKTATTFTEKAKKAADIVRKLKNKEFTFKDSNGNDIPVHKMGISWNDVVEFGAKAIEKTGQIADGIAAIIDKVKEADWYKTLSKADQDRFAKELEDHYTGIADKKTASRIKALEKELDDLQSGKVKTKTERKPTAREQELKDQIFEAKDKLGLIKPKSAPAPKTAITKPKIDIATDFVDKKDNKFTADESKSIWEHAKKVMDGGKTDFHDVVNQVAMDTGLSNEQVRRAIAQPKDAKVITDKMYAAMYKRNQVVQAARAWVNSADQPWPKKFWNKAIKIPSAIVTFGHGSVAPITHVGTDLFRPSNWKSYFNFMANSYIYSFGGLTERGTARYEKAMGDLVHDPMFVMAKRAGLKIDPTDLSGDDYSKYQGVFGKLSKMGERGFNAMKPYRLEQFKKIYGKLSDQSKSDPEVVKAIAHMVNLSSGTTDAKIPKGADVVFFAPKLVTSQYQRIFSEPAKAVATIVNWKNATTADKLQAKMVARHAGEMVATYGTLLAANQAILTMTGSKQKINLTNPLDSDWMKFKMFDKTVDASGGMNSALRFVASLLQEGARANGIIKTGEKSKPGDVEGRKILQQLTNKLNPAAGDIEEGFSGTDMMGNPLPWSSVKAAAGKEKLSWSDYLSTKLPIPIAEGIKTFSDAAKENGMPKDELDNYLQAFLIGALTGTTGAKIGPDYSQQQKPAGRTGRSGGRPR